jgi:hypothetical protein
MEPSQGIRRVIGELDHPHAQVGENIHPRRVGADHGGILETVNHTHLVLGPGAQQVGGGVDLQQAAGPGAQQHIPAADFGDGVFERLHVTRHVAEGDIDCVESRGQRVFDGPVVNGGRIEPLHRLFLPRPGRTAPCGAGQSDVGIFQSSQRVDDEHVAPGPGSGSGGSEC